jgi:hypothetical protein
MRRTPLLMSAAAILFASSTALAQAKPNFSGKWIMIPDTAQVMLQGVSAGGGEMGGLSTEAVIEQNDKTITLTRATPNMGEFKSVFNLDGTETYSSVNVNGQAIPLTMKTRWENNKLITSTWANVGQMIEIVLNFSLDDKGNLVTEHYVPPMGANAPGGTLVTKYKKAP